MPKVAKKTKPDATLNARPKMVVTSDTASYYANYLAVGHTQFDFSITVGKIGSPLPDEQLEQVKKGEPLLVDAILQIIIPPGVAEGLIKALTEQQRKYQELTAKNKEDQSGELGKREQLNRLQ